VVEVDSLLCVLRTRTNTYMYLHASTHNATWTNNKITWESVESGEESRRQINNLFFILLSGDLESPFYCQNDKDKIENTVKLINKKFLLEIISLKIV